MTDTPTVFLVDDDHSVLSALSRLMRAAGFNTASFSSAEEFLAAEHDASAGCLVLDVNMPGLGGVGLQQILIERKCTLPIIFLTGEGDIGMGVHAMKVGAADFLTKPVDQEVLFGAVRAAIEKNRRTRIDHAALNEIEQRLSTLTPREREVLSLVVSGQLNKQIASTIGTVEKTVKVHRARVMAKMKVDSFADLVRMADRAGIESGPVESP